MNDDCRFNTDALEAHEGKDLKRFELTGGFQTMPPQLELLDDDVDVVLLMNGSDWEISAGVAKSMINEVVKRQAQGRLEIDEVAHVLTGITGERDITSRLYEAFESGQLMFWRGGLPVKVVGRDMPLSYGEYTTAEDVNKWLDGTKVTYRFPTEQPTHVGSIAPPKQRSQAQDEAIINTLKQLGHDPLALPLPPPGKRGVKAEVRAALGNRGIWAGIKVFDKAWERLRRNKEIVDANSKVSSP